MRTKFILSCLAASSLFVACSKSNDEPAGTKTEQKTAGTVQDITINASDYTKWIYFSFEQGKELSLTDEEAKKSDAWDIAIHRYDFRTNTATTGLGKGGAYKTTEKDINAKIQIPEASAFTLDTPGRITIKFDHTAKPPTPVYADQPRNAAIDPIKFDHTQMPPKYNISNVVYLVRTAKGKYAKLLVPIYNAPLKKADGKIEATAGNLGIKYVYPVEP